MAAAGSLLGNFREYVNMDDPMGVVVGVGVGVWLVFCALTDTSSAKSRIVFILLYHRTFRASVNFLSNDCIFQNNTVNLFVGIHRELVQLSNQKWRLEIFLVIGKIQILPPFLIVGIADMQK